MYALYTVTSYVIRIHHDKMASEVSQTHGQTVIFLIKNFV